MKKKVLILFLSLVLIVTMMPLGIYAQTSANGNNNITSQNKNHSNATIEVANEDELVKAINTASSYEPTTIKLTANNFSLKKTLVIPEDKIIEIDMNRNQITAPKGKEAIDVFGMLSFTNDTDYEYIIKGNEYRIIHVETSGILTMKTENKGKFAIWLGTIEEKNDGGGILNEGTCTLNGDIMVSNCKAGALGGGVANYGTFTASGCTFRGCTANDGGGICTFPGSITSVDTSTFILCSVKEAGGALCGMGDSGFSLKSCSITDCAALYQGGGVAVTPGDVGAIEDTTIEKCQASYSAAITSGSDALSIVGKCNIINNTNFDGEQDNIGIFRGDEEGALVLENIDPQCKIGVHLNHGWKTTYIVAAGGQASFINKNIFPDYDGDEINDEGSGVMSITVGQHPIITFDSQGGSRVASMEVGKGEIVGKGPIDPTRVGYKFLGWSKEKHSDILYDFKYDFVIEDTTLYAQWQKLAPTKAKYTVEHYLQNSSKTGYTLKNTEILTGKIGAKTQAVAKHYKGYTAKSFKQQIIKKDGSTVVKIYYNKDAKKPPKPDPHHKHHKKHHDNNHDKQAKKAGTKKGALIKTGDETAILLWGAGLLAVTLPLVIRKRRQNK